MKHLLIVSLLLAAACAPEKEESATTTAPAAASTTLTLYSGRNEKLIQPLIDRFQTATGIKVAVRYGETSELAATILEEGARTPADVFLAQDGAALGAIEKTELFQPLPPAILERVEPRFASGDGRWVGLSGRARTVVYSTERMKAAELPQSLDALGDPAWKGRFGVAPSNASFQAHMAAYSAVHGEKALRELLRKLVANQPKRYPNNSSIVRAVIAGEIEFGLVNHYYLWQMKREQPEAVVENFFMPEGEVSSFINVAGAGLLSREENAVRLIEYMLNDDSQRYFAQETFEYPLARNARPSTGLIPLGELRSSQIGFAALSDSLPATLELINQSGLLQ
ncbi:MAG TPA: extracellular solute-binding protein [Thermoanaerobaculia bacterium]|nr:extracellular solute-binding protein [Thermoanaerobaculia bacterium]